jgi:anti-anti-sigma factor
MDKFEANVTRSGDTATISCTGELDIATAPDVERAVEDILASDAPKTLELDWSGLTFMDSTGIRLLMRTLNMCKRKNIDVLWRMSAPAQRALDAVGIHDALLRQYADGD